jgi:hypothetical protein
VRVTITSPSTFELYARVSVWRFISARNVRVLSIGCKRQIPKKSPFQQIWMEALGTATIPSFAMFHFYPSFAWKSLPLSHQDCPACNRAPEIDQIRLFPH